MCVKHRTRLGRHVAGRARVYRRGNPDGHRPHNSAGTHSGSSTSQIFWAWAASVGYFTAVPVRRFRRRPQRFALAGFGRSNAHNASSTARASGRQDSVWKHVASPPNTRRPILFFFLSVFVPHLFSLFFYFFSLASFSFFSLFFLQLQRKDYLAGINVQVAPTAALRRQHASSRTLVCVRSCEATSGSPCGVLQRVWAAAWTNHVVGPEGRDVSGGGPGGWPPRQHAPRPAATRSNTSCARSSSCAAISA